jgi:hypothetical protein
MQFIKLELTALGAWIMDSRIQGLISLIFNVRTDNVWEKNTKTKQNDFLT